MVKLDLNVDELVGLAQIGKLDREKLSEYLKKSTREELEEYILNTYSEEEPEEQEESEEDIDVQ